MANFIAKNAFLTEQEMAINARYIYDYLTARGWSPTAVCGMLGNMETESTINPAIWQNLDAYNVGLGYGLVQWTPSTKFTDWCSANNLDPAHMDSALKRIEWELENGEQYYPTDAYPLTFAEFKVSTESASYLAQAFLLNYERPADQNQPARSTQAEKWYKLLKGSEGGSEGGEGGSEGGDTGAGSEGGSGTITPVKAKKMPLWMIISATRRKV